MTHALLEVVTCAAVVVAAALAALLAGLPLYVAAVLWREVWRPRLVRWWRRCRRW